MDMVASVMYMMMLCSSSCCHAQAHFKFVID